MILEVLSNLCDSLIWGLAPGYQEHSVQEAELPAAPKHELKPRGITPGLPSPLGGDEFMVGLDDLADLFQP